MTKNLTDLIDESMQKSPNDRPKSNPSLIVKLPFSRIFTVNEVETISKAGLRRRIERKPFNYPRAVLGLL